jgi:hypothetical protein
VTTSLRCHGSRGMIRKMLHIESQSLSVSLRTDAVAACLSAQGAQRGARGCGWGPGVAKQQFSLSTVVTGPRSGCPTRRAQAVTEWPGARSSRGSLRYLSRRGKRIGDPAGPGGPGSRPGRGGPGCHDLGGVARGRGVRGAYFEGVASRGALVSDPKRPCGKLRFCPGGSGE